MPKYASMRACRRPSRDAPLGLVSDGHNDLYVVTGDLSLIKHVI